MKESTVKFAKASTVEVKLLIPYGLLTAVVIASAAFIAGWHTQGAYNDSIQARASQMVSSLSKPAK